MKIQHRLKTDMVKFAALRAADIIMGMGYNGEYGSMHLLALNIQTNTLTAILHNLIAWQISELDPSWKFHPRGGGTPDLTNEDGGGIQVKVTSDNQVKANKISKNEGYYIIVKYTRDTSTYTVTIKWILEGQLYTNDWNRPDKTQMAILKREAVIRLRQVYP